MVSNPGSRDGAEAGKMLFHNPFFLLYPPK